MSFNCPEHLYFCSNTNRRPELFYSSVFLETRDVTGLSSTFIPTIFHATHHKELMSICQGKEAIFKGNPKQWRPSSEHCPSPSASYYIGPGSTSEKRISPDDTECLPGPLLWFGTERKTGQTDNAYGPYVFEFKFTLVLEAYQNCRGINTEQLCYRAAGTLVYHREVSHVVLVCSTSDNCYKMFPIIQGNNTKYFKPPDDKETGLQRLAFMVTNQYPECFDENDKECTRHDHIIIAFHLPDGTPLVLPNRPYVSELKKIPHRYCMRNKLEGGACCNSVDDETIEKTIDTKWNQYREPYT